ncbi:MAG TPA: N-acetyltransferase [Vicinamibacterales bacterium]|nr:N-acetyltransferase [Vicinamibacterales bacterium]
MLIRPETTGDHEPIIRVNRLAFGGEEEARLVELIRRAGIVIASLVAEDDAGEIVGHILFSPATILTAVTEIQVASLAPVAVVPPQQRRGIGSMLIEQGLQACRRAGYRAVIVVGHPEYYPRFGFTHAAVAQLTNPFCATDAFMGLELARGSLAGLEDGRVVYPDAFNQL